MKISLATNFDDKLIDEIKDYPVYEIYGKLKNDYIGGGRPDNTLSNIDKENFERHGKKVRKCWSKCINNYKSIYINVC